MVQDVSAPREEERGDTLVCECPQGGERPSQFLVRYGDTQGGGEGVAALDNERPQGGGGSLSYSFQGAAASREEERMPPLFYR